MSCKVFYVLPNLVNNNFFTYQLLHSSIHQLLHSLTLPLAVVSAHPAPYRDPFLRRLAACKDIDTTIFSLFSDDNDHSFWNLEEHGYPSELIGKRSEHWFRLFLRLLRRVIFGGFDVICWPGFHRPCTKAAMIACALLGKRYGFCADSIVQPSRGGIAMAIKRFVVRRASFIFVPGKASRDFFVKGFGCPVERICLGQYALEGRQIEENVLRLRRERKGELRRKYGLDDGDVVFLMVANMTPTRHYPITAAAFMRFAERYPEAKFVMVGVGPELEKMQDMANTTGSLKVIPGVSFAEMQELYALADVYVHGGAEPASTALVIGAISHLPLISSPSVGCSADVVKDGETGVLVEDCMDEGKWAQGFLRLMGCREKWNEFGDEARRLSEPLDCERVLDSFNTMYGLLS